jgi:hypothetical protein
MSFTVYLNFIIRVICIRQTANNFVFGRLNDKYGKLNDGYGKLNIESAIFTIESG